MGDPARGLDEGRNVLTVKCVERDREVVRTLKRVPLSIEKLTYYWEKLKEFPTLFNDFIGSDPDDFIQIFVNITPSGDVQPTGLVYEVDDVGILYMTNLRPGVEFTGHFSFWDGRLNGRDPIIRAALGHVFDTFGFHRAVAEVPLYAEKTYHFLEDAVGFTKEGRKREAVRYKGEWFDVNLYSMLEDEV